MRILILILLMLSPDPTEIAKINRLKSEAKKAFESGQFENAAEKYAFLADSMGVDDDAIKLNLAHSFYQLNDTSNAKSTYQRLMTSENGKLKSVAAQQLGVMSKNDQKLEESLAYLKTALKSDPSNAGAKYDYEVVKKLLEKAKENQENQQNQDQNQDQENQDQQNQDQQNQDQQNQDQQEQDQQDSEQQEGEEQDGEQQEGKEGEQSEEEQQQQQEEGEKSEEEKQKEMNEATRQKLQEMNISEDKARMILEALKNNEIQYIQQRKRKASERPDSDKPDW